MEWWFEREAPMGGASSGAFRNPLAGAGALEVDLFVREAVQNSVDAALRDEDVVEIRFRNDSLEGARLDELRAALGMQPGSEILMRPGLLPADQLSQQLEGPLDVLVVEDFQTVGLGGSVDPIAGTDEDNFRRLCHKVGSTRSEEGGGGSFGYGKATYWAASSLWTVVFYSRFQPTERSGGDWARLVGVSWFGEHAWAPGGDGDEVEFTGRAFLGDIGEYDGQQMSRPIVNDEAQSMAERLGLHVRSEGETGTTAMILGNRLDLNGLTEGVETHWWPRLVAGRLDVKVTGERPPQPLARSDLRPFVRAWELLEGAEPEEGEERLQVTYNRRPLGNVALVLDEEPSDSSKIALVRSPLMVVKYEERPRGGPSQPTCSGVFRAAEEMNEPLRASEPPAHTEWDHKSSRTDRPLSTEDRARIRKIFEKVKANIRDFIRQHREAAPETPPRCRLLEIALGDLFATDISGPPPPPPPGTDPFRVLFVEPPTRLLDGGTAVIDATIEVHLADEAFEDETEVMCSMTASLDLIHDAGSVGEKLPMSYMNARDPQSGEEFLGTVNENKTQLLAVFVRDEGPWRVELRTEPLPHPEYRVRLNFEVEKV